MSLVICRKDKDTILTISDTRLTYPKERYPDKQTGHPIDGTIKSIIISPKLCISFAGDDIDPAEQALKEIKSDDELNRVLEILKRKSQDNKVDFLVCTSAPNLKIFEVKNSISTEVERGWIGSSKAFNKFQGYFHNQIEENKNRRASFIKIEPTLTKGNPELGKISGAFDKVIGDSSIKEVDGFKIIVVHEDGTFKYRGYLHTYLGQIELKISPEMIGKKIPIGHGSSRVGSYTVNFFNSKSNFNNVGLHIRQANLGIVYSRIDDGLLRPKMFPMDEIDFVDFVEKEYKLRPSLTTQNKEQKYFNEANSFFEMRDYLSAIVWFDKLTNIDKGKMKAKAHYAKGICYLNLGRSHEGIIEIKRAIDIDPGLEREAIKLLPKLRWY